MDPENENQQESLLDNPEKSSETENCANNNLAEVTEPPLTEKVLKNAADESTSDLIGSEKEHDTCSSPPSNANPCLESDPKSPTAYENVINSEPSPQSINSEGSNREISLDCGDADGNLKETNDPDLASTGDDKGVDSSKHEKSNSGENSEEKNVFASTEDTHKESSELERSNSDENLQGKNVVTPADDRCIESSEIEMNDSDENLQEKDTLASTEETFKEGSDIEKSNSGEDSHENNVLAPTEDMCIEGSEIEKSNSGEDSREKIVTEDMSVESSGFEKSNSGEDSTEKNINSLLSGEVKISDERGASDAGSYVIDTSIFPGPPIDRDKVVIAHCFQVDDIPNLESSNQTFPSKDVFDSQSYSGIAFPSSTKTIDTIVASDNPGPSDDREDISDEEFDVEPSGNTNTKQLVSGSSENPTPAAKPGCLLSESSVHKSDNGSINSSDTGDIIDLKLEDAALKSLGSSCDTDDNRHSKVSNEDLEAVSDDELPNVPQVSSDIASNQQSTNLLEDREEVSSSEDEELDRQQNSDILPISSGDEFAGPSQHGKPAGSSENNDIRERKESLARLESLEAEPISDEEDNAMANDDSKQASFDDGEAGEIKSPALGSPISEQGDIMLGEMEPVSADDSQDTDGELPSGDEGERDDDKQGGGMNDKKFESIDSDDDDIGGDNMKLVINKKVVNGRKKDDGEYMETISDEENLDEDSDKKHLGPSNEESALAVHKESAMEKGHIPTSFNEHQVELDYEEAYGEDGEAKTESKEDETKAESKLTEGEEGEHVEEGLVSDKDEGELSDDDCEEGEIKEPGIKKMFIKPICRFFQRGNCTWGINCRFLHPGINDKGNYQMIEIPGFKPVGIRARLGVPGQYTEQQPQEEEAELPPPPMPDVPHVETAWERGLRIAKEQRKKASERKEKEPDFAEKRLNLSVDEERELNKENERTPKIIPKDPYYDQQAYEVDEYYKIPRDPWHTGHYENFEVRYHQQNAYSPPYREKPPAAPPMRYTRPLSPPIDKFGRHREERPEQPERHEPLRVSDYPPVAKHPDEWIDPWRRSKSPKQRKPRSRSRGRRNRRSVSDSSDSSRSNSHSSSGSSRSSRSGSGSSGSSSRSRSPEPAPPGVDRMDRQDRYGSDQPRSMVSVRGPENQRGGYNNRYDNPRYQRGGRPYNNRGGDGGRNMYKSRQDTNMYQGGRGGMGYYGNNANNNYRNMGGRGGGGVSGMPGGYNNRDPRSRDSRYTRNSSPFRGGRGATPDRPLPYTRPRPKSRSSSRSSSSRSRSRSRSKSSDSSRSHSSSNSSRSSSSSSSSGGSADSEHLYRDLGSPAKNARHPGMASNQKKRSGADSRKDRGNAKSNHTASGQPATRHPPPPTNLDRIPHPRSPPHSRADPKYSQIPLPPSGGRADAKYASRNAPQPPTKAKDPLKVVGQKSNIKLTLLPKQQQPSGLGDRPNPLASPPHKRRMSDRDPSPTSPPPPAKRPNMSMQASSLRVAADKSAKLLGRQQEKAKSPPAGSLPPPPSSSATQRSKNPPLPASPQKQPASKLRTTTENVKPAAKAPSGGSAASNPTSTKSKKSMSSRREELLKQLKAVEDAIARKKFKMS